MAYRNGASLPSDGLRPGTVVALLAVGLLVVALLGTVPAASGTSNGTGTVENRSSDATKADARILEAYPNPHADGDPGEYVVLEVPTDGNWTLTDGTTTVEIPDRTGRFAVSTEPEIAAEFAEVPVYGLEGRLRLADDGETLRLSENGTTKDEISYGRAPVGARWLREDGELVREPDADGGWRADGFRPRKPENFENVSGRAFVLPDAPGEPVAPIREADDRVYLAAYTLESWRLADALAAAAERGVTVRVLLEGSPVGGATETQAAVLRFLDRQGIDVRVLDGEYTRYTYHHAKYAVADDTVVALTENWKPSGTGGASNRGWGVRVDDRNVAASVAEVFEHDSGWRDAVPWTEYRAGATVREGTSANESYPERFPTAEFDEATVRLMLAPDNAESELEAMIDGADERVAVVVPRTGGTGYRLLEAAIGAAERGVTVRLQLSGAWYDREENEALVEELRGLDVGEGELDARIVEPRGRFDRVHAKGAVIDDTAVVGSLNWNEHAGSRNRELLLAVENPAIAEFYWRVLAADWHGGSFRTPVGLLGGFAAVTLVGGEVARRRVRFA
ncbi:Phosphatidylserine/phosphatidylglycerophosphate/ cardiolipin synthase or related enzyme [Halalkaliarchaeum sp. AArc-CO]|uniref:phospholipase D-like domain-containing protein n=2 Tax=unclassified Halalkaliarchaeum TaxID=2678344 RepID=UPI00217DF283|nr:phospholipase D-like domain-containing protein [Halalkaliarchaeum sp. AArc-CO]UWG50279.1 Phosphatidylserine/phosphatidylglycerophosphate/ cardiolipin synthase or related enzyme [Halalkaliarchaeum sp. AArc-CO]